MKHRFQVRHIYNAESIAVIEMDEALLDPEFGLVEPNSGTMPSLPNGKLHTLVPLEDHTIAILNRISTLYHVIKTEPATSFMSFQSRMDDLYRLVALLFGEIEYVVVESKLDMDRIINPKADYEHKKVKYSVMANLKAKLGHVEMPHECGPDCAHGTSETTV